MCSAGCSAPPSADWTTLAGRRCDQPDQSQAARAAAPGRRWTKVPFFGAAAAFQRPALSLVEVLRGQVLDGWALDDLALVGVAGAVAGTIPGPLGRVPGHQATQMGTAPRDRVEPAVGVPVGGHLLAV